MAENIASAEQEKLRINRYIALCGVCSRRAADRLIEEKKVFINGRAAVFSDTVSVTDEVICDGRKLKRTEENVLLLFNKPPGIVCTAEKREKDNVIDYIGYPSRIFPIGRLDKKSRGLLLLTNRGDFFNDMMKASSGHEKEYAVTVDKALTDDFLKAMASGVYLPELSVRTRKCTVKRTGEREFRIVLTQGLNRQIRRMCEALSYRVKDLVRTRIMNLTLSGIPEGKYRMIKTEEKAELEKLLGRKLWQ